MTAPTSPAFEQLFADQADQTTDENLLEELYYSMIARHEYLVLDQSAAKNLYGEPSAEPSYTTAGSFPIQIKLKPEEADLSKYGFRRPRDAIVWMCKKVLVTYQVVPKVGDRINFQYSHPISGVAIKEQFEIMNVSNWDFQRQTKIPYQIMAAVLRTHKGMK